MAVAVLFWGYHTSNTLERCRAPGTPRLPGSRIAGQPIGLGDSLLTHWFRERAFPGAASVHLSLPAFAGWVGMFITGLNLLPLSQLDGGHVMYGLLGRRQSWVAGVTIVGLLALSRFSPSWLVWVGMTFSDRRRPLDPSLGADSRAPGALEPAMGRPVLRGDLRADLRAGAVRILNPKAR